MAPFPGKLLAFGVAGVLAVVVVGLVQPSVAGFGFGSDQSMPVRAGAGKVVWAADAESPIREEWASGNAFDIKAGRGTDTEFHRWTRTPRVRRVNDPVAQGGWAYALTVRARDRDAYTRNAQRTEIGQSIGIGATGERVDRRMVQGQDRWIAYQIRIGEDLPATNRWTLLQQNKVEGEGNGPLSLAWNDGRLMLEKSTSQDHGSIDIRTVWRAPEPTPRDTWIKILIHVKWSLWRDGHYSLYGDLGDGRGFRRLLDRRYDWTLKYGADGRPAPVSARIGIYRYAQRVDSTVFFDGFNVSGTRTGATLRAFGQAL
jgi:Polysaccharide lyase